MRKRSIHFAVAIFALCLGAVPTAFAQATASDKAGPANALAVASPSRTTAAIEQATPQRISAYTLPPDRAKKAHDINRLYLRYLLISFCYGLIVLWLTLRLKTAVKYRTWAEKVSSRRIIQALVFSPLLILTVDVLELPTGIYYHWLSSSYGLSIQGWPSWFWDWIKGELVTVIVATILIWILYAIIRKSTRRWWLYFWFVSLPIAVFMVFLTPLVIDPLFHQFEPLAQKDPALTVALQNLVQRSGETIPPERMFWMGAAEKTTTLNAYVTGFGASKRIVVWDTTIAKMTTPQIAFVAGHEMGHYVLQHILKGIAFGAVILLIGFYLGYRCSSGILSRWGAAWGIRSLDDWASLPVLLVLLSIFAFAGNPIFSAFSRHYEHQADQYALEVTHGLTPDSGQVGAQAFQVLGEVGLSDPDPNPIGVFLFYDHPPIPDRVKFCLSYDPWSTGQEREFVK